MSETVQIKDSADNWLKLEIFTALTVFSYNLSKNKNMIFRPGGFYGKVIGVPQTKGLFVVITERFGINRHPQILRLEM